MAFVFVLAPARIARGNREALIPFISPFFFSPVSRPHNKFETLLAHSRAFSQREKKARERENRIRRARYGNFFFFFCPLPASPQVVSVRFLRAMDACLIVSSKRHRIVHTA
jgi:hypothetical protein